MVHGKVRYSRSESAVSVNIEGEEIILESRSGNYLALNPVAADVWDLLRTPKLINELIEAIIAIYEVEEPQCSQDIERLLSAMSDAGIVEETPLRD